MSITVFNKNVSSLKCMASMSYVSADKTKVKKLFIKYVDKLTQVKVEMAQPNPQSPGKKSCLVTLPSPLDIKKAQEELNG